MAAGDPVKLGALAANGVFLMTSETGIIINSWRRRVDSKKIEFYDGSVGKTTGLVYHDYVAHYTIKGAVNGATGIMAAVVGTVASGFANTTSGQGVTGGGVYPDDIELSHEPQQLREITFNATQRDAIA
jgi:hypothetical protein